MESTPDTNFSSNPSNKYEVLLSGPFAQHQAIIAAALIKGHRLNAVDGKLVAEEQRIWQKGQGPVAEEALQILRTLKEQPNAPLSERNVLVVDKRMHNKLAEIFGKNRLTGSTSEMISHPFESASQAELGELRTWLEENMGSLKERRTYLKTEETLTASHAGLEQFARDAHRMNIMLGDQPVTGQNAEERVAQTKDFFAANGISDEKQQNQICKLMTQGLMADATKHCILEAAKELTSKENLPGTIPPSVIQGGRHRVSCKFEGEEIVITHKVLMQIQTMAHMPLKVTELTAEIRVKKTDLQNLQEPLKFTYTSGRTGRTSFSH